MSDADWDVDDSDTAVIHLYASTLASFGHTEEAEHWFRVAIEQGNYRAAEALGERLVQAGRLDEARIWLTVAAEAGVPAAAAAVGAIAAVAGDRAIAKRWFIRAYEGGIAEAAANLGALARVDGDTAGAERWFRAAIEMGSAAAAEGLGEVLVQQGRLDEARGVLLAAAAESPAVATRLADIEAAAGNMTEAERWWRFAAHSGGAQATASYGLLLYERGEQVQAERWWRRGVEQLVRSRTTTASHPGRRRLSIDGAEDVSSAESGGARSAYFLALLLDSRGETSEAESLRRMATTTRQ